MHMASVDNTYHALESLCIELFRTFNESSPHVSSGFGPLYDPVDHCCTHLQSSRYIITELAISATFMEKTLAVWFHRTAYNLIRKKSLGTVMSSPVMVTCAGARMQIDDQARTQQAKPYRVPRCPFQGNISRYWAGREVEDGSGSL